MSLDCILIEQQFLYGTTKPVALFAIIFSLLIVPSHECGLSYSQKGGINIGGLIPLHTYNEATQSCSTIRGIDSLKRVEAMAYAVEQINSDPTLLPNITLGFDIYDTCSYDSIALRECLNFIPFSISEDTCRAATSDCPSQKQPVVGVVGAQRSASSLQATLLLAQYHIPLVSFLSTSDELSNTLRYPYFLRTVGPDSYQVNAMIDIIVHYQWTYVAFINSGDTYGTNAINEFTKRATDRGICIGYSKTIHQSYTNEDYNNLIDQLVKFQDDSFASVVILFVHLEMVQKTFAAATRMGVSRQFIWIGSDAWGNYGEEAIRGSEEAAVGCFTTVPESNPHHDFNKYFQSLTPSTSNNPWLMEYLQAYTNCSTNINPSTCDEPGLLEAFDPAQSSHETLVMDSVYAFTNALEDMRNDICPDTTEGVCPLMQSMDGEIFLNYLLKTNFTSLSNGHISFMENGDVPGRYSIRYLSVLDNKYEFEEVGKWNEATTSETVIRNDQQVPWYVLGGQNSQNLSSMIPISVCSKPCNIREREIPHPNGNLCCWTCEECHENEIIKNKKCLSCIDRASKTFGWPNEDNSACVPISPGKNRWKPPIISAASLGVLVTAITFILYFHNRTNILIKASSREVSFVIFIGIFLSYLCTILYVMHPTPGSCYLLRLLPPLATGFIFVSLAVKTVRLFRIFRASVQSAKRPKYITPKSQILLILAVSVFPISWSVIWIIVRKPEVIRVLPQDNRNYVEIACKESDEYMYGVMFWNVVLILACCILAGLTRKLPENYNETKFITFCAFCSLVVGLAFSSTYLAIEHNNAYSLSGYSALGLFVNATVTLSCLFIVKLYAVYFVKIEEWNVRKRTTDQNSSTPSSIRDRVSKAISNLGYEGSSGNSSGEQVDENANGKVSSSLLKTVPGNQECENASRSSVFANKDLKAERSYETPSRNSEHLSEIVEFEDVNSKLPNGMKSNKPKTSYSDVSLDGNKSLEESSGMLTPRVDSHLDSVKHKSLSAHDNSISKEGTRITNDGLSSFAMLTDFSETSNKNSTHLYRRTDSTLSIASIHCLPDEVSIVVTGVV